MKNRIFKVIAAFSIVSLSACAHSGYQAFYKPSADPRLISNAKMLAEGETPKIFFSNNVQRDLDILGSKGFVIVGQAAFNGGIESEKGAVKQAIRVGATVVLVSSKYTGTQTTTTPLFLPNNSTTYQSGSVYGASGDARYSGTSTTYGSTVVPITSNQQRYDQNAIYLVKIEKKWKFGFYTRDLTPEIRKQIERNTGALITIVIEDSPSFAANVLSGDILIGVDGLAVHNEKNAEQLLAEAKPDGGICTLTILRNGVERNIKIPIEPSQPESIDK